MKTSVKIALATGTLAVTGALFLAGTSYAERGFGPRMGMMGPGGPGGPGGAIVHEMLGNVDTNGDSAISQDEINAAVASNLSKFDANSDGQLSLEEFQALWAEITKPMAVRAFQFLDPNGDAQVSKQELDDRFGKAVARFDRNGDGVLNEQDHPRPRFGMRDGPRGGWMDHHGPRGGWMDDRRGPPSDNQ